MSHDKYVPSLHEQINENHLRRLPNEVSGLRGSFGYIGQAIKGAPGSPSGGFNKAQGCSDEGVGFAGDKNTEVTK